MREKETIIASGGIDRRLTALAAVIALVLLLVVLAYAFGDELYGSGAAVTDVEVQVDPA